MSNQLFNSSPVATESNLKSFLLTEDSKSKTDWEYGKQIAQYINGIVRGTNSYFYLRNQRFRKNRLVANGKVDIQRMFQDRLEFNGKINYTNISWKAPAIVATTIARLVGSWMRRYEKIAVTAIDPISASEKSDAAEQAEFVFDNKEVLKKLEEESGVPMIGKDQFVAEDKDDLDAWVAEFNRLPEEIKYEIGVNNILQANGWYDVNKAKALHDSAEVGLVCTYTYMDETGEVHVDWIKPENVVYSYSEYPDFRDTTWRGHVFSMKISELRANYSKQFGGPLTEEAIFEIAQIAKEYQYLDKLTWLHDWNFMFVRPYDEWNVDCIRFEIRSVDKKPYVKTVTKKNKSTILTKGMPNKLDENQEFLEDKKWNIYEGIYVINTSTVLKWGLKTNMIRPQDPKELGDAEFSYSMYMYQNYDMRNLAVPEKVEEPVEQMILARLKIQQLVAKMKPAGAAVNVDSLQELDLGLADSTKPLEVQKIWEQTGNLYYRGKDAEGNNIPVPITELQNSGFVSQMQALIQLYQFHYQVLKDELGDDPNLIQRASQPRVTEGNVQASMSESDNATDYMYDAYLHCMEDTATKVAALLNKSVTYQSGVYRHILKEDEVKGRNFSTRSMMLPTGQEIAVLNQMINTAIASNPNFALYIDQFKLIRIAKENVKLAELYYRQAMKKMIKSQQDIASKNSQENAQIQQASAQQKAQSDDALENKKNQAKERQIIMQGMIDLAKANIPMPNELKVLANEIIKNIEVPLVIENHQAEQAMAQQMQQEQQMAAQQQQGQEQGQEQQGQEAQEPQQQEQGEGQEQEAQEQPSEAESNQPQS